MSTMNDTDDYEDDDIPECDHEEYEIDGEGWHATCGICGFTWVATADQVRRRDDAMFNFDEDAFLREMRDRSILGDFLMPLDIAFRQLRGLIRRAWSHLLKREGKTNGKIEDEIPF